MQARGVPHGPHRAMPDRAFVSWRAFLILTALASVICVRGYRVHQLPHAIQSPSAVRNLPLRHFQTLDDDDDGAILAISSRAVELIPPAWRYRHMPVREVSLPKFRARGSRYNRPPPAC